MSRKTATPVVLEAVHSDSNAVISAEIVKGESIRLFGWRRVGDKVTFPGGDLGAMFESAKSEGGEVWLVFADMCEEMGNRSCYGLVRECAEELADGKETNRYGRSLVEVIESCISDRKPKYKNFDVTYRVGDEAEHGSYNLSYHGSITNITAKTVMIQDYSRKKRLKIEQFARRNYNWSLQQAEQRSASFMD